MRRDIEEREAEEERKDSRNRQERREEAAERDERDRDQEKALAQEVAQKRSSTSSEEEEDKTVGSEQRGRVSSHRSSGRIGSTQGEKLVDTRSRAAEARRRPSRAA